MDLTQFSSVPTGSLVYFSSDFRLRYLTAVLELPENIKDVMFSAKTGAYIRGLVRSINLPPQGGSQIAFAVLKVGIGEISLAQLPSVLSSELKIANDKAQKIAQEIERDLFAPVALELNQYLARKKKSTGSIAEKLSAQSKQSTSPPQVPHSGPLLSPPAGGERGIQGKFPRRPAAPPNILNLKDQRPGPKPPPIPR